MPRFVPEHNYASGFGLEWNTHPKTQYDSYSGIPASETRFFGETGWSRDLKGQLVLEVGSGSGRFTEQAAGTGATVVSIDYSNAVDANFDSNGNDKNILIVQADALHLPVPLRRFDKAFCFGMLQHTPDPRQAFMSVAATLRPGGELVADVYRGGLLRTVGRTKYWVRPITRRLDPTRLYKLTEAWVDLMWPIASRVRRIPHVGSMLNWQLLVADYSKLGLEGSLLKEWAYLDTFDMLAPRFDRPKTLKTFRSWFVDAGFDDIDVRYGYNGVQGRGRRRSSVGSGAGLVSDRTSALLSGFRTTARP